ncbi:MAG: trigger factor [Pseudomonadota bacterium]
MKTTLEHISPVKKKLMVEIEAGEVNRKFDETYKTLGKKARIPGFRPGKVPRKILEKRLGDQVLEDVTKALINETLPRAMQETETYPLSVPVVENETLLKMDQTFKYAATMEVRPTFEPKGYMDLEVEKENLVVTDEDLNRQLEEIRKNYGKLNAVDDDRDIRENDYVLIDYEGFEGGKPLEGIRSSNFLLRIGSNDFHPDFENALVGHKKGDKVEITVNFEKGHYNTKLAEKAVNFKVTVLELKVMELPELNDEFVKKLGAEFTNLDDLKKKLKEEMVQREKDRIDRELKGRLLKKISDNLEFELPPSLVESEITRAIENLRQNLIRAGASLEKAGLKEEKLREDFRASSEKKVKNLLILGEIARRENLTIDDKELSEGFNELAQNIGQDPQVISRYYEENQMEDSFRAKLLEEKTLNYLVKGAKILEVDSDKLTRQME